MKSLKTVFACALLAALPVSGQNRGKTTAHFAIGYDVASTSLTYCTLSGQGGSPWGEPYAVSTPIETSGSSTTVTAVTALSAPFANLVAGDTIVVRRDAATPYDLRWLTAKADSDGVTVSSAVNWSAGYPFQWMDLACGTAATDGWIAVPTGSGKIVQMTVVYSAGDLGGLDVVWEGKEGSPVAAPVRIFPGATSSCDPGTLNTNVCTFTSTGDTKTVRILDNSFAFVRLGLAYRTSDGATREAVHGILSVFEEGV